MQIRDHCSKTTSGHYNIPTSSSRQHASKWSQQQKYQRLTHYNAQISQLVVGCWIITSCKLSRYGDQWSLQHTYMWFITTYPPVVYCNIPTSGSLQHTHKWISSKYKQVTQCNIPTSGSLQHTHKWFSSKHKQVTQCNIPTSGSLQEIKKLFTATYIQQIVHYNISSVQFSTLTEWSSRGYERITTT